MTKIVLPLRTVNSLNVREHWAKRAKRAKAERKDAYYGASDALPRLTTVMPLTLLITRIAPRVMDDDGCIASMKNIRDGIADWLGVNDGSDAVKWTYAQRKGEPKEYAVEIEIVPRVTTAEQALEELAK